MPPLWAFGLSAYVLAMIVSVVLYSRRSADAKPVGAGNRWDRSRSLNSPQGWSFGLASLVCGAVAVYMWIQTSPILALLLLVIGLHFLGLSALFFWSRGRLIDRTS